jgi:succinyl-CoA synthetase beta subunit
MRLYEHEAKQVLAAEGLPVPQRWGLLRTAQALNRLQIKQYPVMVKAQVLVGGRGKAGGVRRAASEEEACAAARDILGLRIKGYPVEGVLVEAAAEAAAACYLAVTVNPYSGNVLVLASAAGGVDIEELARERPEAVLRLEFPENPAELPAGAARQVGEFLARGVGAGYGEKLPRQCAAAAAQLYAAFQKNDCLLAEVNPLLVTADGVLAADAKIVLDENALYRQSGLLGRLGIQGKRHEVAEPTARERRAASAGFAYVDLLSEDHRREPGKIYVGLVPGGAGYGIFAIDEVKNVGDEFLGGLAVPVNFMDSGGGPSQGAVSEMFALLMDHELVDVILTSRFGGISSCDVFIRGLVDGLRERHAAGKRVVPVYGRMVGTDLAAGRAYLEAARQQTPEELAALSMVVGNRQIMAEVIREALTDFCFRHKGGGR